MPRVKGLVKRGRCFYYRIRSGGEKEKQIPLGKDHDIAVTRALDIRRKVAAGEPIEEPEAPTLTVADSAARWLAEHVTHNRSPYNKRLAEAIVERYLTPFMGAARLDSVTRASLVAYRHWLAGRKHWRTKQPLSTTTVRHILADCRSLLNYCLNVGLLDRSPAPTRGWLPRIEQRAPDRLTLEECAVLRGLRGDYGRVLRFLLATGLRWGEMTRAQAKDIRDGVLLVPKSKSGKVRRVPLPVAILAECRGRVGKLSPFPLAGNFNSQVRRLVADHAATLEEEQRKALDGLQRFHVHLTRHTFASEWRESGGSLSALQAILGHSTIRVTEQYGTVADDLVLREARRLEGYRATRPEQNGTFCGTFPDEASEPARVTDCETGGGTRIRTGE